MRRILKLTACVVAACMLISCKGDENPLLSSVPDNTPLFMGGLTKSPIQELFIRSPRLLTLAEARFGEVPRVDTAQGQLMRDMDDAVARGPEALLKMFGVEGQASLVGYLYHLNFIVKLEIQHPDVLDAYLNHLSQLYPDDVQTKSHKGVSYRLVQGAHQESGVLIALQKNYVSIGFGAEQDEAYKDNLFGITQPSNNLKDSKRLSTLVQQKGYLPGFVAYVDLSLLPDAYDEALSSNSVSTNFDQLLNRRLGGEECVDDLKQQMHNWPLITFGYDKLERTHQALDTHAAFEIDFRPQQPLDPLRYYGVIPDALKNGYANYLFSFAQGISVGQIQNIWQDMATWSQSIPDSCEGAAKFKQEMASVNPALMTAMLKPYDIQGLSVALADLDIDFEKGTAAIQAWLSVATEQPSLILNLLSSLSWLKPQDSTQSFRDLGVGQTLNFALSPSFFEEFDEPLLESLLANLSLSYDNQFLTLHFNHTDKALSAALAAQPIKPNGINFLSLSLDKLSQIGPRHLDRIRPKITQPEDCILLDEAYNLFEGVRGNFTLQDAISPSSWLLNIQQDHVAWGDVVVDYAVKAGTYKTRILAEGCQFSKQQDADQLAADGTGQFSIHSDDGACIVYEGTYHWYQRGEQLVFETDFERWREGNQCDQPLSDWLPTAPEYKVQTCIITEAKDHRFVCQYPQTAPDSLPFLVEYILSDSQP